MWEWNKVNYTGRKHMLTFDSGSQDLVAIENCVVNSGGRELVPLIGRHLGVLQTVEIECKYIWIVEVLPFFSQLASDTLGCIAAENTKLQALWGHD